MEKMPIQPEEENPKESENGETEKGSRREEILKDLGKNISAGEPRSEAFIRGAEYIGIYKDGEYIGDVVSDSNLTRMSDKEFQDKVWELLEKAESKDNFEFKIGDGVNDVMRDTGIVYNSDRTLILKDEAGNLLTIDLYNNGENAEIGLEKVDDATILLKVKEHTGKNIEYIIKNGVFLSDSRRVLR